jgi:hypothetical protein
LLKSQKTETPKHVLWGQSIAAAFFWGTSNFLYSVLDRPSFAVTCLSWTGFIGTAVAYRLVMHKVSSNENQLSLKETLMQHLSGRR